MSELVSLSPPVVRPAWVDPALYPFTSRWASLPAGRMHYLDEGARGPTVLFSHGTPSWSFEWRRVISALSAAHRCVAPDHFGFGLSEKPASFGYTPRDHAGQLAHFMEALDLRDVTLVVHDFGGPIGLGAALAQRARVRSVVVSNSWMWSLLESDPSVARISRFVAGPVGRFLYRRLNFSPRVLLPAMFVDKSLLTPAVRRHYLAPFPSYESRLSTWVLGRELAGSASYYDELWARRSELADVVHQVVWAARDKTFGDKHLARWREAFPRAEVTVARDSGHFIAEEAPALVASAVERASAALPATATEAA